MTKVKVKTLIGSVVTVAFYDGHRGIFVICLSGKRSFGHGFGPYDGQRILTFCAILVAALFYSAG